MKQALIALDQFINAWFFWWLPGGTWADETISARAFRLSEHPTYWWLCDMIDALFFWQPSHCMQSYLSERDRNQSPPEERTA